MYLHSSWSFAVTVRTVCWISSFSSTSASYKALSKYGGLSFLSAMPIRMNFVTVCVGEKNERRLKINTEKFVKESFYMARWHENVSACLWSSFLKCDYFFILIDHYVICTLYVHAKQRGYWLTCHQIRTIWFHLCFILHIVP